MHVRNNNTNVVIVLQNEFKLLLSLPFFMTTQQNLVSRSHHLKLVCYKITSVYALKGDCYLSV